MCGSYDNDGVVHNLDNEVDEAGSVVEQFVSDVTGSDNPSAVVAELDRLEVVAERGPEAVEVELTALAERADANDSVAQDTLVAVLALRMIGASEQAVA